MSVHLATVAAPPLPSRRVTADELEAEAQRLRREADEASDRGETAKSLRLLSRALDRWEDAARLRREEMRGLPPREQPANVQSMLTAAQLARRGRAISATKVGDHPLKSAIAASEWGSLRRYAKDRLGISPSAFTGYLGGKYACPVTVDRQVREDFPRVAVKWPKGTVA